MAKSKKTDEVFDMEEEIKRDLAESEPTPAPVTSLKRDAPVGAVYKRGRHKMGYDKNTDVIGYNLRLPIDVHRQIKSYCMDTGRSMNNVMLESICDAMQNWNLNEIKCPRCESFVPKESKFCPHCGNQLH